MHERSLIYLSGCLLLFQISDLSEVTRRKMQQYSYEQNQVQREEDEQEQELVVG